MTNNYSKIRTICCLLLATVLSGLLSGAGIPQDGYAGMGEMAGAGGGKRLMAHYSGVLDVIHEQRLKFAAEHGVSDPAGLVAAVRHSPLAHLLISVAIEESRGDPAAVGAAGELGAWQVKPTDWGTVPKDLHAQAGQAEKIIRALLNSCNGDRVQALAHYNGGTSPPGKSYRYAKRVLKRAKHLQVAVDYLPPENRSPLYDRQLAG